ncbi:MAG: pilus assembly protein PilM [Phycisphaeraceae bacterium]
MFGGLFERGRCPIGVDLGSHTLRLLQLSRRGERLVALAAACADVPANLPAHGAARTEALAQTLRDMLDSGGFSGRQAVSCLPPADVHYKNLRLPPMPAEELAQAVKWEASDRLKLTDGQGQVQFFDAGEVRQGEDLREEIILLAAGAAQVEAHMQVLLQAGLQPVAIDAAPSALARTLTLDDDADAEAPARLLLDVGYSTSKALIVRHGRVLFFKLIDIGASHFDQTVAQRLTLPVAEAAQMRRKLAGDTPGRPGESDEAPAFFGSSRRESVERAVFEAMRPTAGELAREVALCVRYYSVTFRGRRPEQLLLGGGQAYDPHLLRVLAEDAGLSVAPARPLAGIDVSRVPILHQASGTLSQWMTATGLSLRNGIRQASSGRAGGLFKARAESPASLAAGHSTSLTAGREAAA